MKVLLMLILLVFGNAVKANDDYREELFSPEENARVFNAIDYICGDIWCEGYYEYKFHKFSCDKNSNQCDLSFQFIEYFENDHKVYSPVQVCRIDGVYSLDQVIRESNFLHFEFIDKLSHCFGDLAESYRAQ